MSEDQIHHNSSHPIPAVFELLGIPDVKTSDHLSLTYKSGILEACVKQVTGHTIVVRRYVKGNDFAQLEPFDPSAMTKEERNAAIKAMYLNTHTQAELAELFNLSQAMISRIASA